MGAKKSPSLFKGGADEVDGGLIMFEKLIGNEKIKQDLKAVIENNRVSHSYMFIGNKGIGKSLYAKEFAKAILCNNDKKPCLECKSCLEFDNDNNPDFYYIGLREENSIKIEEIRQMQKRVQELPIVSKRKVYIIDDAEYMTKEAQNCLLKTIEEPPEFVTVILITANENKVLNTIQSRCLKLYFNSIKEKELKQYLKDNYQIDNLSSNMLKACNGSIGKALQIYEKKDIYQTIEKVFDHVENYHIVNAIKELEILYKEKELINDILDYINVIFLNKAKENIIYIDYMEKVEETKKKISLNCNYDMSIDSLLFSIWKN